jgi:hypothetical protein
VRVIFIEGGSFGTYVLEQTLSQFVVGASVPLAVWMRSGEILESETLVHELAPVMGVIPPSLSLVLVVVYPFLHFLPAAALAFRP